MRLNPEPFERIKSGLKKNEVRLNDEKRKKISAGDTIIFSKRPELSEKIRVRVLGRKEVKSFPNMDKFYPKEEQDKYGFVIFDIEVL